MFALNVVFDVALNNAFSVAIGEADHNDSDWIRQMLRLPASSSTLALETALPPAWLHSCAQEKLNTT